MKGKGYYYKALKKFMVGGFISKALERSFVAADFNAPNKGDVMQITGNVIYVRFR